MTAVGDTEPDAAGPLDAQPRLAGPAEELGPRAVHTRDVVLALGDKRPPFRPDLAAELRAELEAGLAPVVARMDAADNLRITKHDLEVVFDCERRFVAPDVFEPSVRVVRGAVTHRALARLVTEGRSATPLEASDQAVAAMAQHTTRWYGEFLRRLDADDRAELVADVANLLTAFLADWPPVPADWHPRSEFDLGANLCRRRVILSGKPDLALGRPGRVTARVVIVDFKTGWIRGEHREDLRFYALLETLARGVPPFRCATYYPEFGEHVVEDVTEDVLRSAVRRVVDGAERIEAVRARRRVPVARPGSACTFCADRFECEPGQAHLAARRAELDEDGLASELD